MSVLDRSSLEASPLADLHAIASELSIDGYRRLRRPELIATILGRQAGAGAAGEAPAAAPESARAPETEAEAEPPEPPEDADEAGAPRRRRGRRGGRGRAAAREREATAERAGEAEEEEATADRAEEAEEAECDRAAAGEAKRDRAPALEPDEAERDAPAAVEPDGPSAGGESTVEGVVELLPNGSGFVRVDPPEPSDDDVYISAAQVKRCELVSGDRVTGPKRAPRRSERFASMIRIETINGRPAAELADSARFDDLPAAFPSERIRIGSEDPTLKAIEWLTPFGRGSRVTIAGPPRAGKTEALRRLAESLAAQDELTVTVVLAGARPEEITEWAQGPVAPAATAPLGAPEEAHNGAVEPVIDQARRLAARGSHAVVLIDGLEGCSPGLARRALAAARNIVDGGSLTVVATARAALGGETTVIALDALLTAAGRFPALDLLASGTMRPELLVGADGAEAIARTRIEALEGAA